MAAPIAALVAVDVAHTFGDTTALGGVTLTVGGHERVALLGRNGSGKTTLLRIASTQLRPSAGQVAVAGHDVVAEPDAVRQHLGVVFQSPALDPALTAREALRLQAALVRLDRADVAGRVADALADAGLEDRADDRIGTFSGGMARRLDLARGLLHRPSLALLDEPTTGLDPLARDAFWAVLDRRRGDGSQVVATHAMDEAARCDRVVILDAGRVVADGTPDALTASLGPDALWLDTDDADALARHTPQRGPRRPGRRRPRAGGVRLRSGLGRPALRPARRPRRLDPTADPGRRVRVRRRRAPRGPMTAAVLALWGREIRVFLRDRARVVGVLAQPVLFWVVFGFGFADSVVVPGSDAGYLQYLLPGMVALTVLFTAIYSTLSVVEDRQSGVLQAVLVAPQPRAALVLGVVLGGTTLAVGQAALIGALGPTVGLWPGWRGRPSRCWRPCCWPSRSARSGS